MAYYRGGYGPRPTASYDPYSKYPNFAGALGEFLDNMRMMKEFRARQAQQKWQRSMAEQQLDIQRQRLAQPKKPSIQEQRWQMADANVASGRWTREQGDAYKLTGRTPEKPVKYPATTIQNVQKEFGITPEEWKGLSTQQKGGYIGEYQLRTRPRATRGKLSPEEQQIKQTFEKHSNLIAAAGARLNANIKALTPRAKVTAAEQYMKASPGTLKARVELTNTSQLLGYLEKITTSSLASNRPLMPEYEDAIRQLLKASSEDIRSGKLLQDIKDAQVKKAGVTYGKVDKYGFYKGQIKTDQSGAAYQYMGDDNWRKLTPEELKKYKQPWIPESEAKRPIF